MRLVIRLLILAAFVAQHIGPDSANAQDLARSGGSNTSVSYASDIRPILAANCFGCHQGARNEGKYLMTSFAEMLTGGSSGVDAIVPGKPDESYLVELITGSQGKAQMPPNAKSLSDEHVQLIRRWISEGAHDDYQLHQEIYSSKNPPTYSRLPNTTTADFSPDGKWLAINGLNEILIYPANVVGDSNDKPEIAKRFIGLSSRIESLRFSPDGHRLAASGGSPAEFGEVQVWDVETGKLLLSKVVSHDTIYGVNWSPDSKSLAFGCTDTTVRIINAETGEQTLYQGAHNDWIRDTVFSVDGSQLVSVGRDMTCKLYEVSTQRFIDNITSITPGVLKGGIASVARHPSRDEIVIGGADGITKVYRMTRITKRVIGDDANLVRLMPKMPGRIQSVAVSNDGSRIAAVSSLNGKGSLRVYSYEFDPTVSDELKAILAKQPSQWNNAERDKVESYNSDGVKTIASVENAATGLYAVAFSNDGTLVTTGGADGVIRTYESESGKIVSEFSPVSIRPEDATVDTTSVEQWHAFSPTSDDKVQKLPAESIASIQVLPKHIDFSRPNDYVQLVAQIRLKDGTEFNAPSGAANYKFDQSMFSVSSSGLVQPIHSGESNLIVLIGNQEVLIPVKIDLAKPFVPEFREDVNPILTKLGCNAGTCHGSADGKMGFKLSLRGYDPVFDFRAFTDDMGSRRTNLASPDASLMLVKPTASVPHSGGQLIQTDSKYYRLIREWIAAGVPYNQDSNRVVKVELFPRNPVIPLKHAGNNRLPETQQMRLVATYSDGTTRDVTREGFIEAGGMETATIKGSTIHALRQGETPIIGRYEGLFTATTLTVMGDREGFAWKQPETWGQLDELVANKWKRMKVLPSELCSDDEFVRRIYLDLTGLPPTAKQVIEFVQDSRSTREKRDALIDQLIGSEPFVEHWSNKWADLLQVNRKYLGPEGAKSFRGWIRDQVRENRPYDQFAYDILTATGSNRENPAASYFKIHRTAVDTMENTTHLFLATRFNCNKCHDHPFERWTQDQYFETAAWFAQVSLSKDPSSGDMRIGGTAVEGAKPLYEIVSDADTGEIKHDRTGEQVSPAFPFDCNFEVNNKAPRRVQLASWITSPDNPYFATSYVNRLWGYMMGSGLIEPLDDLRASNPPTNPQLLNYLETEFLNQDFDMRHVLRLICKSRTYQLSIKTNAFNQDDQINYSHATARRLPAEVLFDSIHFVTGSKLNIPGVAPGTRAAELPDSGATLPSGFLATLGRPARESVCECERSSELQLGSVLALVSGPDVARAIDDPNSELARLVATQNDNRKLINQIYLKILSREATDHEVQLALETLKSISVDHKTLLSLRDERQAEVTRQLPAIEKERQLAIDLATKELDQSINQLDPDLLKKEASRTKAIADTKSSLEQYTASAQGKEAWIQKQLDTVQWHPFRVANLKSKIERGFTVLEDRSVLMGTKPGKDVYTILGKTDLTGITAIRLELLPHETLGAGGPGLAENGNIVLTEFEMEIAHPDRPEDWHKVPFESAAAFFEQTGYPVGNSFNGKKNDRAGWAMHQTNGKVNWATYQLALPTGFARETLVRFRLHQQFDETHQVGRFRIALTRDYAPGLSVSESLLAELVLPADKRKPETDAQLTTAFRKSDKEFARLELAHMESRKPITINPEIVRLREKLARVSLPIPEDSRLAQLNKDTEYSEKQAANQRLTAAQDLAWALINSPSFLFNR